MLVVIPSAGIGSRLGEYTLNINKGILPVQNIPSIVKIIKSYPLSTEFILIVGYKSDSIITLINFIFPKKNIKIIKINKFNDYDGSLTYSIKKSLKYINKPFFFHANDTIIVDKKFYTSCSENTVFISKHNNDNNLYRGVKINKNKIIFLNKKSLKNNDIFYSYIGVAYIHDFKAFKNFISNTKKMDGESGFIDLNQTNFKFKKIEKWIDIGNIDGFESNAYLDYYVLPKKNQHIYFIDNKVIKFFSNEKKSLKIQKKSILLKKFSPKTHLLGKHFIYYNYIKGSRFDDQKKFKIKNLLNHFNKNLWCKKIIFSKEKQNKFLLNLNQFYKIKTQKRVAAYLNMSKQKDDFTNVNNEKIPKIKNLLMNLNWDKLCNSKPVNIHGDFHFENLIFTSSNIYALDPREDFYSFDNEGDIYYDLAKFLHGILINHKSIFENKFSITYINKSNKNIFLKIKKTTNYENKINDFYYFCEKNNFDVCKINIICSLIYLNIACLHHSGYSNLLFYFGKFLLYKNQIEKNYIRDNLLKSNIYY